MSSTPVSHTPEEPLSPADSNDGEDLGAPQTSVFIQHVSAKARRSRCVSLDHLYSRPCGWRSDRVPVRQARLLLVDPLVKPAPQPDACMIDVESVDEPENLPESEELVARDAMEECQQHVATARDIPDDLIEQLDQSSWSAAKRQLLRRLLSALTAYQLARRALQGRRGAAFAARTHADRCASRVRRALAAAGWQRPICQWLHGLLLQKLGRDALALYLEVLQTLAAKVPSLVGRLTAAQGGARQGPLSAENLAPLLRQPWDPAAHIISQHKMKRLPNNPIIVLVPSSPCHGSESSQLGLGTSRLDFWHRQLSALGKVVPISVFEGGAPSRGISVSESLSHILAMCRSQVGELRRPGRPLVLLGWGAAGLVAAHLALLEPVSAVVALGFPCRSAAGQRGRPDDPLLELRTPCLLLVGQTAADAAPHELELMRHRMRAETGLVVVGGADSRLLVNAHKKQREALTQSMLDRAIMEEIAEFLTGTLTEQLEGTQPLFPKPPTPPPCKEDAVLKNLARDKRRKPPRDREQQPKPPRPNKPPRTARPRPKRTARPAPPPPEPPPASASVPAPQMDGDDSLSEAPIIDLIQDVEPETPEPEPSPAPPPPVNPSPLKIATTPPVKTPSSFVSLPSSSGGMPSKLADRPPTFSERASTFGDGPFAFSDGSAARLARVSRPAPARGGRLKVTQKLDAIPGGLLKRGRGRARGARGRVSRYGVTAREYVTSFGMTGSSRFLSPVCAAAAGRARAAESPSQLVYVRPSEPTAARRPEQLVVLPGRQLLVTRGRARTVTYVPAARAEPAPRPVRGGQQTVPRPPEHEYAADAPPRYVQPAGYLRPGRTVSREEARQPPPSAQ